MKPFWNFTSSEIDAWIRQLTPGVPDTGGMLFPKRGAGEEYQAKAQLGNALLQNLLRALSVASSHKDAAAGPPQAKRPKIENGSGKGDMYNILDPSFARSNGESSVDMPVGAILSRMTLGGLVNGLAGAEGGVVETLTCIPLAELSSENEALDEAAKKDARKKHSEAAIATAGNLPLKEVIKLARGLQHSVAARTEMDILATTPRRIADLLCPEISNSELNTIRRRVYETVVLGMGTNSSAFMASLEEESKEVPVAARTSQSEVEQYKRCNICGNTDQSAFVLDGKQGDMICTACGTVVSESLMHEGSQFRKFEGEEDRNHHGDAPNPLFSNSHNLATSLGGVTFDTGAGKGGYGSGTKGGMENTLRNIHSYVEMNISQFGKEEKKTRIGYKDRQKKDAFYQVSPLRLRCCLDKHRCSWTFLISWNAFPLDGPRGGCVRVARGGGPAGQRVVRRIS